MAIGIDSDRDFQSQKPMPMAIPIPSSAAARGVGNPTLPVTLEEEAISSLFQKRQCEWKYELIVLFLVVVLGLFN